MPRSCRPGLRGIAVFGRCGAGASAMREVYRRAAPPDHRMAGRPRGYAAAPTAATGRRSDARNQIQ